MADKVPKEFSSYVSPDSLRKTTQLLKNLYDMHTKRYCGYEDINGSQYVGTVENFGSEMLLEARKILLDKPSLKNIFIENTFDFYFDIQYSELIDTYDQQNMLCAVLKKDVFLSKNEYRIRFDNIEFVNIPRAQSWSDPTVYRDPYIKTTTPPVLIITDSNGVDTEIDLILSDNTNVNTTYYFRLYTDMIDVYSSSYDDIINGKTLTTNPINDSMYGRPFIWMCVDIFNLLPDIGFINNEFNGSPFLTIGTNGHDSSLVYPAMNIRSNNINGCWLIKVIPDEDDGFVEGNNENNYTSKIKEIHLLKYNNNDEADPRVQPIEDIIITYDDTYSKISLIKEMDITSVVDSSIKFFGEWFFNKPRIGDYDYDGRTYKNICYAYTSLETFINNFETLGIISSNIMTAGFKVGFKQEYVHKFEALNGNAVSGIHVDVTSDHSDNGVSKKNGVIHDLGDFDGLPPYFKYMIKNTIHRAHTESYVIRDCLDEKNKSAMDKQTAAIIIDSGIPQNEVKKITADMPIVIQFDWHDQINRKYDTVEEPVSKNNSVSEITYVDDNTFGNSKIAKYQFTDKFVYHGNRLFSLGLSGFDPELEMGRVYLVTNDKAAYENNETTNNKKAPRTFARICDIPTEFAQLVNIKNFAPTLIIDSDYVRTEVNFETVDKEMLYNLSHIDHAVIYEGGLVYPSTYNLTIPTLIPVNDIYPKYIRINETIDLNDIDNVTFEIGFGGSGYNIDDRFLFYIGGLSINGIVKEVDEGVVTKIAFLVQSDEGTYESNRPVMSYGYITRSNLKNQYSVYDTEKISTNGEGLTILMSISDTIWNSTSMMVNGVLDNIFTFKFDYLGNIWAWEYDNDTWIQSDQITGIKVYDNAYDQEYTRSTRSLRNVFMYNLINPISNDLISEETQASSRFIYTVPKTEDIFTAEDRSNIIEQAHHNCQNGFFFLETGISASDKHDIFIYDTNRIQNEQNELLLPAYHDINLSEYTNKSNKIRFKNNDDVQPTLYVFNPTIDTVDEFDTIYGDICIKTNSKPMLLSDVFDASEDTPENVINQNGYLSRNVYIYDEYDTSDIKSLRLELTSKTRDQLIKYITDEFPNAYPLKFEGSEYPYTEEMLIDYIITNTLHWGRSSPIYHNEEAPETIYRRPPLKLFRTIGEEVEDKIGNPIGEQPSGAFQSITTEIFDHRVKLKNINTTASPLLVFRIDNDEITSLKGFRLLDDLDNDVSEISLLILNNEIYIAKIEDGEIDWIKINRLEDNEQ